ncbi:MAG TPA: hybrid sensor histidine kinase/response regulator [Caldimonas sp.]|jgi:signal transduction histidine kinase/ActR/RegA family two-component response regulator
MLRPVRLEWIVPAGLLAAIGIVAVLATHKGGPGSLLPHGYCFTWNPALLWTHVASDSLIGAAYVSIPITLLHLVRKRTDLPFNWIVVLFAVFIVSCGATHWVEVWTVWNPDYWLSANVKLVTAVSSLLTAAALVGLIPHILAIPSVEQLSAARDALEVEVGNRRRAEATLLDERAELEHRVLERTEQLSQATALAQAAHAAAEEANTLKDRFLAKVSHELRTPLQSTLTWAQVLKQSVQDPAQASHAAERIMHNVRSQARLIDDLLDLSRILSGKLRLEVQEVDGAKVIEKAAEVVRSATLARGVSIDVSSDGKAVVMQTDPVRLEQVVWNLINNAVHASPEGGRVQVAYAATRGRLRVEVKDWGRGIDAVDLPLIFEPFRQAPGAPNSHRGLGLGLAITRSIVHLFDGELHAHSDGPGRGASFVVELPMSTGADEAESAIAQDVGDEDRQRLRGLRVLYVEDEEDIAEGGRLLLSSLGVQVEVCLRFEEASARVPKGGFDVLLCDLNLGDGHDALELLAILRRSPDGARVPAVVLSAYGGAEDRDATGRAGFRSHIVKPADANTVARALLDALRERRAGSGGSPDPAP